MVNVPSEATTAVQVSGIGSSSLYRGVDRGLGGWRTWLLRGGRPSPQQFTSQQTSPLEPVTPLNRGSAHANTW